VFSTQSVSRWYKEPILSSERMLHEDYDRKGSVAKENLCLWA
jgi:hypothetical protein